MSSKDFKVKNKLQVAGITSAGPLVSDVSGNIDSAQYVATQYGGTGTTTSPNSGQILYSSSGTTYTPTTLSGLPGTYAVGNTASRPGSPITGQIYSNTQTGYIEVYTSAGWSQLGVIPISATIGSPTDVGTNITYGSGSVDVAFTPASTGGLASSFTAISTPGSISTSGSSSPLRVTGLTQGTSYIFTVTATNGYGNALASNASSSITPTSLPQAPTIGTATNVTGVAYGSSPSATVTLTPGATGGKSISNYKYSTDGTTYTAFSPAQTSSPFTVPSLTSGTSYTFTLKSVTANGDSVATAASNSITATTVPQAPTIGTATITNTTTVSIPFTAGATGNSSITSYTVTSSPSIALTTTGTTSPLTATGSFVGGTAYTFTIVSNNANGSSIASSASNSIIPLPIVPVTYWVLAGGGSGGDSSHIGVPGGGGGAGGIQSGSINSPKGASITVTVGGAGSNSVYSTITALAGGGGGCYSPRRGYDGGCGGGGTFAYAGGTGSQGGSGGAGSDAYGGTQGGGGGGGIGGGGAAAPGAVPVSVRGGVGGSGTASSISGTSVTYGGGGGGGSYTAAGAVGGSGGGGRGAFGSSYASGGTNAVAGTVNLGGGGGGRKRGSSNASGAGGGSGVVILSYPDTYAAATSTSGTPTYTPSIGGNRVYKFTGSGSITF